MCEGIICARQRKCHFGNVRVCVCVWVCLFFLAHRVGDLGDGGAVGEGVAVLCVVDEHAGQEHGPQVVTVQDVHRQRGGRRQSVGEVRRAVLQRQRVARNTGYNSELSWGASRS